MSMFNAKEGVDSREAIAEHKQARVTQKFGESPHGRMLLEQVATLRRDLTHERHARKASDERADGLADELDAAAPNRAAPGGGGPTCAGCGVFRVAGPIPCQACGFAG
jgi:hypothetical protein